MSPLEEGDHPIVGHRIHRWLKTGGYYHFLLGLLFTLFLIQPLSRTRLLGALLGDVSLVAVLVAATLAVSIRRWRALVAALLVLPAVYLSLLPGVAESGQHIGAVVAGMAFFAFVVGCLFIDLFQQKRIDAASVSTALCVYMLLAVLWGFVYTLIEIVDPEDAFRGISNLASRSGGFGGPNLGLDRFLYFSLVTLTTLGYGDVTPISRTAQTYSTLEAVVGQLFLVVIVARLVAIHVAVSMSEDKDQAE